MPNFFAPINSGASIWDEDFNWGGQPNYPTINSPSVSTGGVLIQSGQSWYEDLLNSIIGLGAIGQGATHIPTTAHQTTPSNYNQFPTSGLTFQEQQALLAAQNANAGGALGSDLQNFVTKNFTWIAIAGAIYLLYKSGRK